MRRLYSNFITNDFGHSQVTHFPFYGCQRFSTDQEIHNSSIKDLNILSHLSVPSSRQMVSIHEINGFRLQKATYFNPNATIFFKKLSYTVHISTHPLALLKQNKTLRKNRE
jgi:hypothetical protein